MTQGEIMKHTHRKYQIEAGDSTSNVANKLGLSVAELVYYHNLHCEIVDEYIYGDTLPENLKHILLPIEYEHKIPDFPPITYSNNKVEKSVGKTIKKYGVTQRYFKHTEKMNLLNFEVDITEEVLDGNCLTTFNKYFVRVNNSDNFRLIEQLYNKIDNGFYPLILSSNKDGSFKEIVNSKEIKKRWVQLRPELEDYYQGETSQKILSDAEVTVCNTELYGNNLLKSIFFKLWHTPVYRSYAKEETVEFEDHYFIFLNHTGVKFKMKLDTNLKISENNKFIIHLTGVCIDKRSELELWNTPSDVLVNRNPDNKIKGIINITFKINEEDKRFFSVAGFIELEGKINHKRIEIGIYEL